MPPKTFNPIDVVTALGKLVLTVIDTKVFSITNIDQAVIATPVI